MFGIMLRKEKNKVNEKLYVIVNQGLHPIEPKLKKQFGEKAEIIILTEGNLSFDKVKAKVIMQSLWKRLISYEDMDFYIIWSGLNVYNIMIFRLIEKMFNKNPILLLYNNKTKQYDEWDIDPRKLIFDK